MYKIFNFKKQKTLLILFSIPFLVACKGETSSTSGETFPVIVGEFIDSAVEGVEYRCGNIIGFTDKKGSFSCNTLPVSFHIGGIQLGEIKVLATDNQVFPQDLVNVDRNDMNNNKVLKLATLLQSFDSDGNAENGLSISKERSAKFTEKIDLESLSLTELKNKIVLKDKSIVFKDKKEVLSHLSLSMSQFNIIEPTPIPTVIPTPIPTVIPTPIPTVIPTPTPTVTPTPTPTVTPTPTPTVTPTPTPTVTPTPTPTVTPTPTPTVTPTPTPTVTPTPIPSTITRKDAIKFLKQASIALKEKDIEDVIANGYEDWIDKQFQEEFTNSQKLTSQLYEQLSKLNATYSKSMGTNTNPNSCEMSATPEKFRFLVNSLWWERAFEGNDQLRQKIAYALSQIIVTSDSSPAGNLLLWRGESMAYYYDVLQKNAFGNYKNLLNDITYSPTMAYYMTYIGSAEYNLTRGTSPDENYARELMQLFTIGVNKLNIDGSAVLENGKEVPIYTQNDVVENSKVFTGWDIQNTPRFGRIAKSKGCYALPIKFNTNYHDKSQKSMLGQTIPAGQTGEQDIESLLTILMNHQNVAPYISKALIIKMTTSNPSPAYIQRVAEVFNDNGEGLKGDLKAVVKAILLDEEVRGEAKAQSGRVDELLTAMVHTFSTLNVQPTAYWKFYNNVVEKNRPLYWIASNRIFSQSPMMAKDVFNFYAPSFAPNDANFFQANLVAPETQIQTARELIRYSNFLGNILADDLYSVTKIEKKYKTYDAYMKAKLPPKSQASTSHIYLDLTSIYNVFEKALDGTVNDDFSTLKNEADLERAVTVLVDHLDNLFLGSTLPQEYKTVLISELKRVNGTHSNPAVKVKRIVINGIRAIVTSPFYMVIR